MNREDLILALAIALLTASVMVSWFDGHEVDHDHQQFFRDMRDFKNRTEQFMNAGDRNTAADGRKRDARLDKLESMLNDN